MASTEIQRVAHIWVTERTVIKVVSPIYGRRGSQCNMIIRMLNKTFLVLLLILTPTYGDDIKGKYFPSLGLMVEPSTYAVHPLSHTYITSNVLFDHPHLRLSTDNECKNERTTYSAQLLEYSNQYYSNVKDLLTGVIKMKELTICDSLGDLCSTDMRQSDIGYSANSTSPRVRTKRFLSFIALAAGVASLGFSLYNTFTRSEVNSVVNSLNDNHHRIMSQVNAHGHAVNALIRATDKIFTRVESYKSYVDHKFQETDCNINTKTESESPSQYRDIVTYDGANVHWRDHQVSTDEELADRSPPPEEREQKVRPRIQQRYGVLRENNVEFDVYMFKPELHSLAKSIRIPKQYVADDIIYAHGNNVLRLPPYHCQFNAIEEVWSQCKRYYDGHVGRYGFGDAQVTAMWQESLGQVSDVQWQNYIKHAEALIEESWQRECGRDLPVTAPVTIHLGSDTDTDSEYDSL
ncbi:hypothetical protein CBL_20812 [Carabus blaptoides fortunei]